MSSAVVGWPWFFSGPWSCCWLALVLLLTLVLPLAVAPFGLSLVRGPTRVCVLWPGLRCVYLVCSCVLAWTFRVYILVCSCVCTGTFRVGSSQIGANSGTF